MGVKRWRKKTDITACSVFLKEALVKLRGLYVSEEKVEENEEDEDEEDEDHDEEEEEEEEEVLQIARVI